MTLAEAIKSDKKIKRQSGDYFYGKIECVEAGFCLQDQGFRRWLSLEDIVADDWIIEEKEALITKTRLSEAFYISFNKCRYSADPYTNSDPGEVLKEMIKYLSLEETEKK